MSQPFVSTSSKSSKEHANPNTSGTEIDLSNVITDVVPLSIIHVHATPMRKARTSSSRKSKPTKVSTTSTPSITASNMNDPEPLTGVNKHMSMTNLYLDPISIKPNVGINEGCPAVTNAVENVEASRTSNKPSFVTALNNSFKNPINDPDVHASTLSPEKSQDKERSEDILNELGNKDKNLVDQPTYIINIEELDSDDVSIGQRLAPGIAKRLKNRKDQAVGSSNTPSKFVRKKDNVGPTKSWSKVVTPTLKKKSLKRKEVPTESSEFDQDVEHNVQYIISTSRKQAYGKKIPSDILEYHFTTSFFTLWKILKNGNMFIKEGFRKCYEILVKKLIMNISKECDNKRSKEFRKVYVRGRCVDFYPEIINRFLGRNEEEQAEIEVSNNFIYKEIIAKQVKEWPRKGKLSISALSAKYVVLHRIGAAN
ncbi:uncharacterized protein LOC127092446 [Lathyrus oleraceus]|uniref:uncharacterized protein LOC127092446 n=1 Tax=Pisum sativum TaxID=3888 RepID=UPI0021D30B0F|nr:uncharacterized protein LOC127092446 [Pisum sativum]